MFKKFFCDFNLKNGASNLLKYPLNTPFWVIILTKLKILTKNVKNSALNFTTKIIIKNRFQSLQFKSYKQLTVFYEGVIAIIKKIGISRMPGYLGNFPNTYRYLRGIFLRFWKFPRYPGIWEFPKYPDIWGISQIPKHLGNFHFGRLPNIQSFEKFPKSFTFTILK